MSANKLLELVGQPGPLRRPDIEIVASRLNSRLRVVTS
jgi:hypothetical protein